MFEIRPLTPADRDAVMPMVLEFYRSPAVEHDLPESVLERSFQDAADPAEPLLDGYLLLWDGKAAGYCYVTNAYSAEVGGRMALVEELYFKPEYRGRGLGSQVFAYVQAHYPRALRIRLEVSPANRDAARLYTRLGFRVLPYEQMILDRNPESAGMCS